VRIGLRGHRSGGGARGSALAAALVLAVGGCGADGEAAGGGVDSPAAQAPAPAARPASPPAPPPAPPGRSVRFRAADGLPLRGELVPGRGARSPAVVLVHESNGGPDQFENFAAYLHEQGYAALTYRSRPLPERMDETENARDIAGAVRALRRRQGIDPERIAVVGASIGATSAAYHSFSSSGRRVRATVGLSPGTFLDEAPPAGAPRDVLLIADEAELPAAEFLAADSPGITARVAPLDGHGVALLEDARVRAVVLDWLRERLNN